MVESPCRIAVFTGTRAEYGLLRHLIRAIEAERSLNLQLIVSGSHLSAGHGRTVQEIEADGVGLLRVFLSAWIQRLGLPWQCSRQAGQGGAGHGAAAAASVVRSWRSL